MGWGRTFLLGDVGNRLDISDYPKIAAHQENMLSRTAVQRAITAEESGRTS